MAWGVEARVPFLDLEFLDLAMAMDAEFKSAGRGRIEKAVLREAFEGDLPDAILWRQKEQFSDGVGYGWIDGLKAHAERIVSDAEFAPGAGTLPDQPAADQGSLLVSPVVRARCSPAIAVRARCRAASRSPVHRPRRSRGTRPLQTPPTRRDAR